MIELKELENRLYKGRQCIAFTYIINMEELNAHFEFRFYRTLTSDILERTWIVQVIFPRTEQSDSQVYYLSFELPTNKFPLTVVCATGLRYFQDCIMTELQKKNNLSFMIDDALRGMK